MIGCNCPVCRSDDPRDQRTRTSAVFEFDDRRVLIDTSPELRLQCIAARIDRVDAVLYTHHHADHVVGLDDVRVFCEAGDPLPVYASHVTHERIRQMFGYAFDHDDSYPSAIPRLDARVIDGPFELFGRRIVPIALWHGPLPILGFRVGDIAYCTDCSAIPDDSMPLLADLDVLILDGLRRRPHPTHFNLDQAVGMAARIGAARTYLTHIAHELAHATTNRELPAGVELAYDGLVCESPA